MTRPLIGITVDRPADDDRLRNSYTCGIAYGRAVARAGGVPVMLPIEVDLAARYVALCDGVLLTGGVDPDVRAFGQALHPKARLCDPRRQSFEIALLRAAEAAGKPVLGICFGMQLMTLLRGGSLNQYMPDTMDNAAAHQNDARHLIDLQVADSHLGDEACIVMSWHQQCMETAGSLRIIATAPDGVIEAVDDPGKPFYVGVQWHPERGGDGPLNQGLIERFVGAASSSTV